MVEFARQYGSRVSTVSRPYTFIEFDTFIQKAKKSILDARGRRHLNQLNTELQDVQRIMVQNIDDVLQRGVAISGLSPAAVLLPLLLTPLPLLRTGQQGEQPVHHVSEVQEGREIPEPESNVREGSGCWGHRLGRRPVLLDPVILSHGDATRYCF